MCGDRRLARPAESFASEARTQLSARQPLLYAALAFAGGLWAGKYMWRPPTWWVVAALVFVCCATYLLRRRAMAAFALAFGAIFATGALTMQVRGPYSEEPLRLGNGAEVVVTARVIAEGDLQQDSPGSWHQRIDVETEKLEAESENWETHAGIRLNIYSQEKSGSYKAASMPLFRYGTAHHVSGNAKPSA